MCQTELQNVNAVDTISLIVGSKGMIIQIYMHLTIFSVSCNGLVN